MAMGYIKAAHYFGREWPINFWSASFRDAPADFARLRADGFNAVILVVPWGDFQPSLSPIRYNQALFERLRGLARTAGAHGLQVILRLGYCWGSDPSVEAPGFARANRAFTDERVRQAWLDYVGELERQVRDLPMVTLRFFSWEDLSGIHFLAAEAQGPERTRLARALGYTDYVAERGVRADAALPDRQSPDYRHFLAFVDHVLVERFFKPARSRMPALSMEARVDWDPVFGGEEVDWFTHYPTFRLPGAEWTTAYFSVALGAPNDGRTATAAETLSRQQFFLETIQREAGDRRVFIDQYLFYDNTAGYERNTAVAPDELAAFLEGAAAHLQAHTHGYGLWTYQDYETNVIDNPDFTLGERSWRTDGRITPGGDTHEGLARLAVGQALHQTVPAAREHHGPVADQATLRLTLTPSDRATDVAVRIQADAPWRRVRVPPGQATLTLALPAVGRAGYEVSIGALDAPLEIRRVKLFKYTQRGDVYDPSGRPLASAPAIRRLNGRLA